MALIGGIFNLKVNGTLASAKGDFTYAFGSTQYKAVTGSNGKIAGFTETATVPYIEGEITDSKDLDVKELQSLMDGEITLELANGKVFVLSGAHWSSEGQIGTAEGNIAVRFEGTHGDEF